MWEHTFISFSLSHTYSSTFPGVSFKHFGPVLYLTGLGLTVTQKAKCVLSKQFQSAGLDGEVDMFVEKYSIAFSLCRLVGQTSWILDTPISTACNWSWISQDQPSLLPCLIHNLCFPPLMFTAYKWKVWRLSFLRFLYLRVTKYLIPSAMVSNFHHNCYHHRAIKSLVCAYSNVTCIVGSVQFITLF